VAFIAAHQDNITGGLRWGAGPVCHALQVAPSTYYGACSRPPSARAVRDAPLGPELRVLWERNYSVYGRRELWKAARRAGIEAGRDQVARLMRAGDMRGASRAGKRRTAKPDPAAVRAPDLVRRDFTATAPDRKWVADFTYCSTWSGVVYVAFVIDVFSRRIVGWKAARPMSAPLVIDALTMAAWTRRHARLDGLVCHSDAGSQYTSVSYTERLTEIGAAPSIGTVGTVTITRSPRPPSACSRPNCTAIPPPRPPTAAPGAAWTTWRSPPATGPPGSAPNGCTQNSGTRPQPRSKTVTVKTALSPARHERPKLASLHQTQAGSRRARWRPALDLSADD
jgi:putative transposase